MDMSLWGLVVSTAPSVCQPAAGPEPGKGSRQFRRLTPDLFLIEAAKARRGRGHDALDKTMLSV